jgi:hypothetical protein
MKNKVLIFQAIGLLLFVFFFFSEYYFDVFIYDTIYIINYFYLVLVFLIIGNIFFTIKFYKSKYVKKM